MGAVGRWSVWFRGFPGGDLMRVYFLGLLDLKSVRVVMLSFLMVVFVMVKTKAKTRSNWPRNFRKLILDSDSRSQGVKG